MSIMQRFYAERLRRLYGIEAKADDLVYEREPSDVQLLLLHYKGFVLGDITIYHIPSQEETYSYPGKGLSVDLWSDWNLKDNSFFYLKSSVTRQPGCLPSSLVRHLDKYYTFRDYIPVFLQTVASVIDKLMNWPDLDTFPIEVIQRLFTPAALFQMYPTGDHFVNVWWHLLGSLAQHDYSHYYKVNELEPFLYNTFYSLVESRHGGDTDIPLILHEVLTIFAEGDIPELLYRSNIGGFVKSVRSYQEIYEIPRIGKIQGLKFVVRTLRGTICLLSHPQEYLSEDAPSTLIESSNRLHVRSQAEEIISRLLN